MPNLTMAPPMAQTGTNMTCLVLWQVNWSNDTRRVVFSNIFTGVYHRLTWHIPEDRVMSTMSGSHTGQTQWRLDTAAVL